MDGKLITIEGVSGIGKSFYFNELQKRFKSENVIFNKEIMSETHKGINQKIFEILTSTDDPFFNLGNPRMETLLIAAKQANDEENLVIPSINTGKCVISDRGYDTICILEGILYSLKYGLEPLYYSKEIYEKLSLFNTVPDKTILLTGDIESAIKRAEIRNKRLYTEKEKEILRLSSNMFLEFSKMFENRFEVINVDDGYEKTMKRLERIIRKEGVN